jgi:hypothetical protein
MKHQLKWLAAVAVFAVLQSCNSQNSDQTTVDSATGGGSGELDRTVLPHPEPNGKPIQSWMQARQSHLHVGSNSAKGVHQCMVILIDDMALAHPTLLAGLLICHTGLH